MQRLDRAGFAVSTGAACHAGRPQPSPALMAMGVEESEALASLRVSFGVTNDIAEVDAFLAVLAVEVGELRRERPAGRRVGDRQHTGVPGEAVAV